MKILSFSIILRTVGWLAAFAAVVGLAAMAVNQKKEELKEAPVYGERPIPVESSIAKQGHFTQSMDYLAEVESVESALISSRISSSIERIHVDEGDMIEKGESLIQLDSREIESSLASSISQIEQAQAELQAQKELTQSLDQSLQFWQKELNRYLKLLEQGNVSQQKFDEIEDKTNTLNGEFLSSQGKEKALEHKIQSLNKKKEELKTRLSYTNIESPYQGIVTRRHCDSGELAQPGKVLLEVDTVTQKRLAFDVPQNDKPLFQKGLSVLFTLNGQEQSATVSQLFPAYNEARMLRAEVLLSSKQSKKLQQGAYVPIQVILHDYPDVVLVPQRSLVLGKEKDPYVFVIKDDHLVAQPVTVLGEKKEEVAVKGIEPGAEVVLSTFMGWSTLSSGLQVEVIQ